MMPSYRRPTSVIALLAPLSLGAGTAMAMDGFHGSITGALALPNDSQISNSTGGQRASTDLELDNGFALLAAAGYSLTNGLRTEIELGWRRFATDRFKGVSVSDGDLTVSQSSFRLPIDGNFSTVSLMANAIFGYRLGPVQPYVGGGLGLAMHTATWDEQVLSVGGDTYPIEETDESDTVLAYQAVAGIGYPLSDTTELRLGYRYFGSGEADFDGARASYGTHNFEAGVLFRF